MCPGIAPIWKPAERCPECSYNNDQGFCFCQQCGFRRDGHLVGEMRKIPIDIDTINSRLNSIQSAKACKPYQKQKSHLQKELEVFLASLPSPQDLIRFLIWKDGHGKTKIHADHCEFLVCVASLCVHVLLDSPRGRWTVILGSYEPF